MGQNPARIGLGQFLPGELKGELRLQVRLMKEGLKGDDSPLAKVLDEKASKKEIGDLAKLIKTMDGTKAPVGDQDAYDEKVAELIAAMDAIAGGADTPDAFNRLDEASNCKACHSDHKPKKK